MPLLKFQPSYKGLTIYPSVTVGFQCYTGYCLSVACRHFHRFSASSGVRFFSFTNLYISLCRFISALPLPFSSFRLPIYFSFRPYVIPCAINVLTIETSYFPFFAKIFLLLQFLINYFISEHAKKTSKILKYFGCSFSSSPKKYFLYLIAFPLTF